MSIRIDLDSDLARAACDHLRRDLDQVGFFLADVDDGVFTLREWRPIPEGALECAPEGHAVLTDGAAVDVIRWAHERHASLVEVHSHGRFAPAAFSRFDVAGLAEWVPGVRWRLRGAPYAAAVVAADTADAWAWVDSTNVPTQVETVLINGTHAVRTTGATLELIHAQLTQ